MFYLIGNLICLSLWILVLIWLAFPESKFTRKGQNIIFYFSKYNTQQRKRKKDNKKRNRILNYGTKEEQIKYFNSQNSDYQMMTDNEVYQKYDKFSSKISHIIDTPSFVYNSDERKVIQNHKDEFEIKNNYLQKKPGNVLLFVDNYTRLPKKIKEGYKLVVYREKTKNYRFKLLKID